MKEFVLDHKFSEVDQEVRYAGIWPRLGAVLIDGLVVSVISWFFTYFLKDFSIYLPLTILTLCYQPFMEFRYSATLGKMAFGLKVINRNFEKPELKDVLIRDIFWLILGVATIIQSYFPIATPSSQDLNRYFEYSDFINALVIGNLVNFSYLLVVLVDGIVMISNNKSQALHDKIAKTYVIKQR